MRTFFSNFVLFFTFLTHTAFAANLTFISPTSPDNASVPGTDTHIKLSTTAQQIDRFSIFWNSTELVMDASLLLNLHFNESASSIASDSFNEKTGALGSGASQPTFTQQGFFGGGYQFDGGDYITMGQVSASSQITLMSFARWSMGTPQTILGTNAYQLGTDGQHVSLRLSTDCTNMIDFVGSTVLAPDTWYHLAATYDGATVTLYVNGVSEPNTYSFSGSLCAPSTDVLVGNTFTGTLDEVRLYSSSLSSQVLSILSRSEFGRFFAKITNNPFDTTFTYSGTVHGLVNAPSPFSFPTNQGTVLSSGGSSAWDDKIRERGFFMYENGMYHMWYGGWNNDANNDAYDHSVPGLVNLGYATSPNGTTWTKFAGNPINNNTNPDISNIWIEDVFVVKDAGVYYMYAEDEYTGDSEGTHINLFTSTDKIHWTLTKEKALARTGSGWESSEAATPVVWKEGSNWYMLYEGIGTTTPGQVGLATSSDGVTWQRYANNPLFANPVNTNYDVAPDSILLLNGVYHLYGHYFNGTSWLGGLWTSTDRVTWAFYGQIVGNSPVIVDNGIDYLMYTFVQDSGGNHYERSLSSSMQVVQTSTTETRSITFVDAPPPPTEYPLISMSFDSGTDFPQVNGACSTSKKCNDSAPWDSFNVCDDNNGSEVGGICSSKDMKVGGTHGLESRGLLDLAGGDTLLSFTIDPTSCNGPCASVQLSYYQAAHSLDSSTPSEGSAVYVSGNDGVRKLVSDCMNAESCEASSRAGMGASAEFVNVNICTLVPCTEPITVLFTSRNNREHSTDDYFGWDEIKVSGFSP